MIDPRRLLGAPPARDPAPSIARRRLLATGIGAAGVGIAAGVGATGARAAPSSSQAPTSPAIDLDDPTNHLRTYVRMRGSADGSMVVDLTQGFVYALQPRGRPRLLFQSRGMQLARYREDPDGAWVCRSSYFGSFADAGTGALIETWENPFTGQRDTLPPTLYGPMDYVLTASRTLVNPTPPQRAAALAARTVRRWMRIGDLVTIVDELGPADDPAKPADLDVISLSARAADLADGARASVPSQMSFGAVEPWRDWMRMGERPGMLLWHLQGTKVAGLEQVPRDLLRAAEARRAGFVEQASG